MTSGPGGPKRAETGGPQHPQPCGPSGPLRSRGPARPARSGHATGASGPAAVRPALGLDDLVAFEASKLTPGDRTRAYWRRQRALRWKAAATEQRELPSEVAP